MNIDAYLQRIDYAGSRAPTSETLCALHRRHLETVPFENLDIHLGRPISLEPDALFDKIVTRRRGGFCYELNGAFAALLRALGFSVTLLSARVPHGQGVLGPEFDHMALLVQLDERWLADVGFGDSFRDPLRLDEPGVQAQRFGDYRVQRDGEQWSVWARDSARESGGAFTPSFTFTLQPRSMADFDEMCRFHQTSPESHFTRGRVCSLATPEGRVTLRDRRLILTANGTRTERELAGEAEYAAALRQYFHMAV